MKYKLSIFAALALISLLYLLLAARGVPSNLFAPAPLSAAYDSLGESLKRGEVTVDRTFIYSEEIVRDGKTTMYFGPLPAMLRMPLNSLFPDLFGRWGRLLSLAAALLSLAAFIKFAAFSLRQNPSLSESAKRLLFWVSLFGFALGSPMLFVIGETVIYNEAILWGCVCSGWALYFLARLRHSRSSALYNRRSAGVPGDRAALI
jgi:hypothetical protein